MELISLLQSEATQNQYIFNFVLINIIFILSYKFRRRKKTTPIVWLLSLVFCLFAYWDTDYFSFREGFYTSLKDFRDPLYYGLSLISFSSYTIFRLYIWGGAMLLLIHAAKRLKISENMLAFIFPVFFLLIFSYARVSLGMAMYFYGISVILTAKRDRKIASYIWGILFIVCSYFGHRSMVLPIICTPLIIFKFNKYTIAGLFVVGAVMGSYTSMILSNVVTGDISTGEFGAVGEALDAYASKEAIVEYNWKYTLTQNLKNIALVLSFVYLIWKCYLTKDRDKIPEWCKRMLNVCSGIFIVAISILVVGGLGAGIIGYRFLYMLGIPLAIILTYLYCNKLCSTRTLYFLLLPMFLFSEGFIFGKILSF